MRIARTFFLMFLLWAGLSAAEPDEKITLSKPVDKWLAMDKLKHFSTSFYLTTTVFYGQNRIFDIQTDKSNLKAVGLTISFGVLKELRDSRQKNNYFSWRDLVADILGTSAAVLVLNRIE